MLTDIIALVGVYYILGGTLTALFAASMCGLIISGWLHVENNKDKFLYLYDTVEAIKEKLAAANEALNEYGAVYRAKKEAAEDVV